VETLKIQEIIDRTIQEIKKVSEERFIINKGQSPSSGLGHNKDKGSLEESFLQDW
jgi:hypothetical protein